MEDETFSILFSLQAELISNWHQGLKLDGGLQHDSRIDVTGGITLKLQCASKISQITEKVWILDGRQPNRIIEAVTTNDTVGTRVTQVKLNTLFFENLNQYYLLKTYICT